MIPVAGQSHGSELCHHLFGLGSELETKLARLLAVVKRLCYPGRRPVQQRTDCRHFLQRHGDAIMEAGCWTFALCRHGERHHNRFRQRSQKAADQMKEFHGRALDFLVANGPTPNQCFCVRYDQRTLATRKHELWESPGNSLINHTYTQKSDHFVKLAL